MGLFEVRSSEPVGAVDHVHMGVSVEISHCGTFAEIGLREGLAFKGVHRALSYRALSYFGGGVLRQSRGVAEEDRKDCESVAHDDFVVGGNKWWWWEKGGGFRPALLPRVYTNYKETALSRVVLWMFSRLLAGRH